MDDNKTPIQYLAFNQCPKCCGMLKLRENEITTSYINKYGLITDSDDEYIIELECIVCHSKYDADKKGNHYFIKNELPKIEKPKLIDTGYNPFQL